MARPRKDPTDPKWAAEATEAPVSQLPDDSAVYVTVRRSGALWTCERWKWTGNTFECLSTSADDTYHHATIKAMKALKENRQ